MKNQAKLIMDAFYKDFGETPHYDDKIAVANAIRAIIDEYEYFQSDDSFGNMVVSSSDLRTLAYELENLK